MDENEYLEKILNYFINIIGKEKYLIRRNDIKTYVDKINNQGYITTTNKKMGTI